VHDPIKAARPSGTDLHETGAHDPARNPRATSQTPAHGGRLGSHVNLSGGRVPVAVQPTSKTPPTYVDTAGASEITKVSRGTLANWRSAGIGPRYYKVGQRCLYDLADLHAFVAAGLVETSAA
jgi:hypothetical protein